MPEAYGVISNVAIVASNSHTGDRHQRSALSQAAQLTPRPLLCSVRAQSARPVCVVSVAKDHRLPRTHHEPGKDLGGSSDKTIEEVDKESTADNKRAL